jgi:hypothetical protein
MHFWRMTPAEVRDLTGYEYRTMVEYINKVSQTK